MQGIVSSVSCGHEGSNSFLVFGKRLAGLNLLPLDDLFCGPPSSGVLLLLEVSMLGTNNNIKTQTVTDDF